tara:strand:- start:210 stop:689 length:480 start_codon:yes stop_codon:yes gene_type:complete
MSLNWPNNNHNYVGAYQTSALPYVTSSSPSEVGATNAVHVHFPYVTRWVMVRNIGPENLRVGFTANGVLENNGNAYNITASNANYFLLSPTGSSRTDQGGFGNCNMFGPVEVKCTDMFFLAHTASMNTGFSLMAGYTNIPRRQFLHLTGASGSDFRGVG